MSDLRFRVDVANNEDDRFYVDILGYGSVCILTTSEALRVLVYPFHVVDEPLLDCSVKLEDLIAKEDQ